MANKRSAVAKASEQQVLKGWKTISGFLGQPQSVVKRWHAEGMPVTEEGRFVQADSEELTKWIGTERGQRKPIRIAAENENLTADLKEALSYVRKESRKE